MKKLHIIIPSTIFILFIIFFYFRINRPVIEVSSVNLEKIEEKNSFFNLNLEIENNYFFDFKIDKLEYKVNVNDNQIIESSLKNKNIDSYKKNKIKIPIVFNNVNFAKSLIETLFKDNSYTVNGNIKYSFLFFSFNYKFEGAGNIKIPDNKDIFKSLEKKVTSVFDSK